MKILIGQVTSYGKQIDYYTQHPTQQKGKMRNLLWDWRGCLMKETGEVIREGAVLTF